MGYRLALINPRDFPSFLFLFSSFFFLDAEDRLETELGYCRRGS